MSNSGNETNRCVRCVCVCFFFCSHFHFPASGQVVVTGVVPSSPRFLPSIFIAPRVQQSRCSSIFHRVLLTHALALSASQFVHKKKSQRIYTSIHSAGLELTKLTYTRLEDNLIRHRGDRLLCYRCSVCLRCAVCAPRRSNFIRSRDAAAASPVVLIVALIIHVNFATTSVFSVRALTLCLTGVYVSCAVIHSFVWAGGNPPRDTRVYGPTDHDYPPPPHALLFSQQQRV